MKTISFTEFRKKASAIISDVEHGEIVEIIRYGKPVAKVYPAKNKPESIPLWKKPGLRLKAKGKNLTKIILEEREES